MPRKRPTIGDVAERAGVSKGAVSFAFNGSSGVSEETRQRIFAAAAELGWQPNRAAKALSQSRSDVIGLVINRPMRTLGVEPFFSMLTSGIQVELATTHRSLQFFIVDSREAEIETYRRWWLEQRVDGLVLLDPEVRDPRIEFLEELGMPTVVVGSPESAGSLSCVWADDSAAMSAVVEHLVGLGHDRIAHVCGMPGFMHTQRRIEVLREAVRVHRVQWGESFPTDFSDAEGERTTRELLAGSLRPTAIVYDSDVMALAGLGVALECGLGVPSDLSILSFDDSIITRLTHPSITALTRDTFDYGAEIARAMTATLGSGKRVVVQCPTPTLVVRESTGSLPITKPY